MWIISDNKLHNRSPVGPCYWQNGNGNARLIVSRHISANTTTRLQSSSILRHILASVTRGARFPLWSVPGTIDLWVAHNPAVLHAFISPLFINQTALQLGPVWGSELRSDIPCWSDTGRVPSSCCRFGPFRVSDPSSAQGPTVNEVGRTSGEKPGQKDSPHQW